MAILRTCYSVLYKGFAEILEISTSLKICSKTKYMQQHAEFESRKIVNIDTGRHNRFQQGGSLTINGVPP